MTNGIMLPNKDVSYLDNLLLDDAGLLRVHPAATLTGLPWPDLALWGNKYGVYVFPTAELVEWLKTRIRGRTAVEICAGHGAVGRAVGVPRTDSYIQTTPDMVLYYALHGQTPIAPPADVERLEAAEAVAKYKPQVVFGCFVTQKYQPGDEDAKIGSSVFGVDEFNVYDKAETYIVVGNLGPHKDKRLFAKPHDRLYFDWIVTRSLQPQNNRIFVWDRSGQSA